MGPFHAKSWIIPAIANCFAGTEYVIESPLAGADDDRSWDVSAGIIHDFAWNGEIDSRTTMGVLFAALVAA